MDSGPGADASPVSMAPAALAAEVPGVSLDDRIGQAIARHLVGEAALPEEIARWREAVRVHGAGAERERDRRLWSLIARRPALIGVVDAGLALFDPHGPVRHRLFLMLAILEASPGHTARFLPRPYPRLALAGLALRMALAALRSALGLALVAAYAARFR
jgi:hypothetical protein